MLELHNFKGQLTGQVQKNLNGEDVRLLASNINQTTGTQWQTIIKFRDTKQSFPAVYGFALCLRDAFVKEPFFIELSKEQVRAKLRTWLPAAEVLAIMDAIDIEDSK